MVLRDRSPNARRKAARNTARIARHGSGEDEVMILAPGIVACAPSYSPKVVREAARRFLAEKGAPRLMATSAAGRILAVLGDESTNAARQFIKSAHLPRNHNPKDEACEKSPNCVHIKVIGRKPTCFSNVDEGETIGTLTEKVADDLGVDKRNWGFYLAGSKTQREFLPNNAKVREIKLNHDKSLHFLPRTVIR